MTDRPATLDESLAALLEAAPDAMVVTDTGGRIAFSNTATRPCVAAASKKMV